MLITMANNPHIGGTLDTKLMAETGEVKTFEEQIAELNDQLNLVNDIVSAAYRLRNSGYDGPFIGEVTRELFSALAELEKTKYFTK